jgi:hypothetical protein
MLFTSAGNLQKSDNTLRAWSHSGIMCLLFMPWVFPFSDLHWCSDCHYQKSEPVHQSIVLNTESVVSFQTMQKTSSTQYHSLGKIWAPFLWHAEQANQL